MDASRPTHQQASAAWTIATPSLLRARAEDEWLLTNALGGFAMGTVSGVPTRRYHAWLIGAASPPVGRTVALSTCAEWLVNGNEHAPGRHDLSSFRFAGCGMDGVHPQGRDALVEFRREGPVAAWVYQVAGVRVTRELTLLRGENACIVQYAVAPLAEPESAATLRETGPLMLEVRPLFALRDFHALRTQESGVRATLTTAPTAPTPTGTPRSWRVEDEGAGVAATLSIETRGATCSDDPQWWREFAYAQDAARGQDSVESLWSPGVVRAPIPAGLRRTTSSRGECVLTLRCVLEEKHASDASVVRSSLAATTPTQAQPPADSGVHAPARLLFDASAIIREDARRIAGFVRAATQGLSLDAPRTREVTALVAAADQCIVRRGPAQGKLWSIIAGYPWFSDWGRDTCISVPGLLLSCGRCDEALGTLEAFASMRRNGLIPNCFDNAGGNAEYNTADASLWFIHASCEYVRASGDHAGFSRVLLRACMEVIEAYRDGTEFAIRVDPQDGLVRAGNPRTQLTWMDAQRDGVVFTPRHGKAVELSALWHHALRSLAPLVGPERAAFSRECDRLAQLCKDSFEMTFWCAERGCLWDVAPAHGRAHDAANSPEFELRPNQLFAISLAHTMLRQDRARSILGVVSDELLTPLGVRTLQRSHPSYAPRYEGPLRARDGAYHQGTVWPWLIGPYVEALLRTENYSARARTHARAALAPLLAELVDGRPGSPVGHLAEVYDAEGIGGAAQRAGGCIAQAWSVAEVLRAWLLLERGRA